MLLVGLIGAGGGELAGRHSGADFLLGLLEGFAGGGAGFEEDKAVAFGSVGDFVTDDLALLDCAEGFECGG